MGYPFLWSRYIGQISYLPGLPGFAHALGYSWCLLVDVYLSLRWLQLIPPGSSCQGYIGKASCFEMMPLMAKYDFQKWKKSTLHHKNVDPLSDELAEQCFLPVIERYQGVPLLILNLICLNSNFKSFSSIHTPQFVMYFNFQVFLNWESSTIKIIFLI